MKKQSVKDNINELETEKGELLLDLQRTRADFENFRKNVDLEKERVKDYAQKQILLQLLPIIDNIELATAYLPDELTDNEWVKGVLALNKKMQTDLAKINLKKIIINPDEPFNPEFHEAIMVDDSTSGEQEVITEELQPGYLFNNQVLRPSTVKVAYK